MKNTVLRYGLLSILSIIILFALSSIFLKDISYSTQEVVGYAGIIISLSFVFFGIKHFKDRENNGILSFGKGVLIGLLITLFAAFAFGLYNIVYVEYINPDFMNDYYSNLVEKAGKTLSGAELQAKIEEMESQKELFSNPFMNFLLMTTTVFVLGLIISIVSSLLLKSK